MQRLLCSGLAIVLLVGAFTPAVMAQRDAGAKARGEFGWGFWNNRPPHQGYYVPYYRVQPMTQATRSFSYEPTGVQPGDIVAVNVDHAQMMSGKKQVGTMDRGQEFKVQKVTNGWLLAELQADGKTTRGWVWHESTRAVPEAPPVPPGNN